MKDNPYKNPAPPPRDDTPWRVQLPNGDMLRRCPTDIGSRDMAPVVLAAGMGSGVRGALNVIDEQNRQGHRELLGSGKVSLPAEDNGMGRFDSFAILQSWGVVFPLPDPTTRPDPLFRPADLPEGWEIRATAGPYWSGLMDQHGRERAAIFYKAAFYDRNAHITVCCRFTARGEIIHITDTHKTIEPVVRDGNVVIWRGPRTVADRYDYDISDAINLFAQRHLDTICPHHKDFMRAWADATEPPVAVL